MVETESEMVNPITVNGPSRARPAAEAEIGKSQGAATAAAASASSTDELQLSSSAHTLPEALRQGPPIDRALVDKIGAAIAEGRYPLKPDAIATAIVQEITDIYGIRKAEHD